MSRIAVLLGREASESPFPPRAAQGERSARRAEYQGLVSGLFHAQSAVAVIRTGSGEGTAYICHEIAGELSECGRRVVVVAVEQLLRMNSIPLPDDTSFMPGNNPNVWLWPAPLGQQLEFFKASALDGPANWLNSLRSNFDSVLLDCPSVEARPAVAEVAAMAGAAVLVVEAGRTARQQIKTEQRMLQARGAILAGCILIRRK